MTPLPDFLRDKALDRNIAFDAVPELWRQHCEWSEKHDVIPGGRPWEAFLDAVVSKASQMRRLDDDASRSQAEALARREAERRAKDAADAEYAKHAVSLQEYIDELRLRPDFGETMTPLEAHIARFRDPWPGEDSAAWLMAAVDGYRGPIDERHKRRRKV